MASRSKKIETLEHDGASRKNMPTAEFESVLAPVDPDPIRVAFERRNRDLDLQLVWRGKDVPGPAELMTQAPPALSFSLPVLLRRQHAQRWARSTPCSLPMTHPVPWQSAQTSGAGSAGGCGGVAQSADSLVEVRPHVLEPVHLALRGGCGAVIGGRRRVVASRACERRSGRFRTGSGGDRAWLWSSRRRRRSSGCRDARWP